MVAMLRAPAEPRAEPRLREHGRLRRRRRRGARGQRRGRRVAEPVAAAAAAVDALLARGGHRRPDARARGRRGPHRAHGPDGRGHLAGGELVVALMRVYLWTAPDEASESDAFWKFCLARLR